MPSYLAKCSPVAVVVLQAPLEAVGDVGGDVPLVDDVNAVDDVAKFPFPSLWKRTIFRPATIALYFELKTRTKQVEKEKSAGGPRRL